MDGHRRTGIATTLSVDVWTQRGHRLRSHNTVLIVVIYLFDFAVVFGAPERIRTPDPQIRSLVL
jgi:hypothetical protein